ncbi:4-oxalocrotonate tautomerase (plasmid) [Ralstonia solanacearum]|nr:4-oxalocrotonate tautomerase [Ralstonia solanacearum]
MRAGRGRVRPHADGASAGGMLARLSIAKVSDRRPAAARHNLARSKPDVPST